MKYLTFAHFKACRHRIKKYLYYTDSLIYSTLFLDLITKWTVTPSFISVNAKKSSIINC